MRTGRFFCVSLLSTALVGCALMPEPDVALYDALGHDDLAMAANAMQESLESAREGEQRDWRNPSSGNAGAVVVGRTYVDGRGAFCRDYRETIVLGDGRTAAIDNSACRSDEGKWQWI